MNMETQTKMLERLVAKAEEDKTFRDTLLADPRTALKETFGIEVPADFNVVGHEDDARTAHLVLPNTSELTDAQLEQAAGGGWCQELVSSDWS